MTTPYDDLVARANEKARADAAIAIPRLWVGLSGCSESVGAEETLRGLRATLEERRIGARIDVVGCRGARRGNIRHSLGRRDPLRRLQPPHAVTTFSHVVRPPRLRGITWSNVRSGVGNRSPQYWQWKASRRNTLNRVNAGRRADGM